MEPFAAVGEGIGPGLMAGLGGDTQSPALVSL